MKFGRVVFETCERADMQTDIQMLIAMRRAPTGGEVIKVLQLLVLRDFVPKIPYLGSQLAKTAVAPAYESVRLVIP